MSRKRTFALLAALAALAALLSACGGGGGGSSEDPQKVIEQATFEGVESGDVHLTMNVKAEGENSGNMKIDLSGPFQSTGKESLPELAMEVKANGEAEGENVNFEGGLTVLGDRAYVGFDGKSYEVDPTTFGFVKSSIEKGEQEGEKEGAGGQRTACQKAATSMNLEEFVDNLENEGGEEVEGVKTTKLSGDLAPKGAIDAIIRLMETPACSAQLEAAGPLPLDELKSLEGEITGAIKSAHAEIYVGEDDHIVRKVVADMKVEPKGTDEKVQLSFDFTLGGVNEQQTIKAPANALPLEKLFGQLGVNPLELLGMMESGGTEDLGSLLEGVTGGASGSESAESLELPSTGQTKEFNKCLSEAKGASDLQQCAKMME